MEEEKQENPNEGGYTVLRIVWNLAVLKTWRKTAEYRSACAIIAGRSGRAV